eukprot:6728392-Ditylum_brightwellii.AAC.1
MGCYDNQEEKKKDNPKPAIVEKTCLRQRSNMAGLVASQQKLLHKVDGLAQDMKDLLGPVKEQSIVLTKQPLEYLPIHFFDLHSYSQLSYIISIIKVCPVLLW